MLQNLQRKWGVSGKQLLLILLTFAIGGSLSGYAARFGLRLLPIEGTALRIIAYVLIVTLVWPLCVLAVSLVFGQFPFFRNYLGRLGNRVRGRRPPADPHPLERSRK